VSIHITRDAVLDYEIVIASVTFCEPPLTVELVAQPRITGMRMKHADDACVLDVIALRRSLAASGSAYPITCSCGVPDDTGINAPIGFSRDVGGLCWHLDMRHHGVLFEESFTPDTKVTLRFDLAAYTRTVDALHADIRRWTDGLVMASELGRFADITGHLPLKDTALVEAYFPPDDWSWDNKLPDPA